MKIIFLDMDGVLNSIEAMIKRHEAKGPAALYWTDPILVERVNKLIEDTGAYVVVSSTWRKLRSEEEMNELLKKQGVECSMLGCTPNHVPRSDGNGHGYRGDEIKAWLKENEKGLNVRVDSFIILDDDSDMDPFMDRLVQTKGRVGLQDADCDKARSMLNDYES